MTTCPYDVDDCPFIRCWTCLLDKQRADHRADLAAYEARLEALEAENAKLRVERAIAEKRQTVCARVNNSNAKKLLDAMCETHKLTDDLDTAREELAALGRKYEDRVFEHEACKKKLYELEARHAKPLSAEEKELLERHGLRDDPEGTARAIAKAEAEMQHLIDWSVMIGRGYGPAQGYSFVHEGKRYWPRWQFEEGSVTLLPNICQVIAELPENMHPLSVTNFFTEPRQLNVPGRTALISVVNHLRNGGDYRLALKALEEFNEPHF